MEQVHLILALVSSSLMSRGKALTLKPSFPQMVANGATDTMLLIFFSLLKIQASKQSVSLCPTLITHIIFIQKELHLKLKNQLLKILEILGKICLSSVYVKLGNLYSFVISHGAVQRSGHSIVMPKRWIRVLQGRGLLSVEYPLLWLQKLVNWSKHHS